MNIAIVGCGNWGKNIIKNLFSLKSEKQLNIKYICDKDSNKARIFSQYCENTTDDYTTINDIDAVIISTPANTHYEICRHFLQKRINVFVEKPMTLSYKHAFDLIEIAKNNDIKLMVGHTFVYNDAIRKIKQIIDSGEIGEIIYLFSQRLNLGTYREDHNVLWNLAPHDLSIILYLLNNKMPESVMASGLSYLNKEIADICFVELVFENMKAYIHNSWLNPLKERKITIVGSDKMIVFDDLSGDEQIKVYNKGMSMHEMTHGIKLKSGDVISPKVNGKDPLTNELRHFIECIIENKESLTSGTSSLNVIKILEACDLSLISQSRVVLPQHNFPSGAQ